MSPRTAGRHHGPSGRGPSPPGQLANPAVLQTRGRVTGDSLSTPRALVHGPESPGTAGLTRDLGPEPESPGTADQPRGPSDPSAIGPGELVEPVGMQTRARLAQDSWSTPRALGLKCEWPETAAPPHRLSDAIPSVQGQLIDTEGTRTWARFARDNRLTPQGVRHRP